MRYGDLRVLTGGGVGCVLPSGAVMVPLRLLLLPGTPAHHDVKLKWACRLDLRTHGLSRAIVDANEELSFSSAQWTAHEPAYGVTRTVKAAHSC